MTRRFVLIIEDNDTETPATVVREALAETLESAETAHVTHAYIVNKAQVEAIQGIAEGSGSSRSDRTVWRLTAADFDAMAGRELSDEELDRAANALDNESVSEAILDATIQAVLS